MSAPLTSCPACLGSDLLITHRESSIPTNSCLLLPSLEEAAGYPRGDLALTVCKSCGFVFNSDFDVSLSEYSARYEETQGYSARFVEFARDLAKRWVQKYSLEDKSVIEIGCGSMGEFLQFMVEGGAGHAIGIDPALNVERIEVDNPDSFTWIPDFYSEKYADLQADAVVCRHTLEHIQPVREFMEMVRRAIGDRPETIVLFELPDVRRVLDEVAFWDVYYEHCSYFSLGSLARLFRETGFEVLHLEMDYDDQYLLIEARPSAVPVPGNVFDVEDDIDSLVALTESFGVGYTKILDRWRTEIAEVATTGAETVIWGAGSKGVSFLTNLGSDLVSAAVDINPVKRGMYMAGTGHEIISPEDLVGRNLGLVIVMNPIYLEEIQADLDRLSLDAKVLGV